MKILWRIIWSCALGLALSACASAPLAPAGQWLKRASLTQPRSWLGTASVGGKIYAIGGMTGAEGRRVEDNEVFDPRTNAWTWLAPMPYPSASAGTLELNDLIYVIGGNLDSGATGMMQVYDPTRNIWNTRLPPMPTPRYDFAVAHIGNVIYAFGGFERSVMKVVEAFDATTWQWRGLAPMREARYAFDALVMDGKIYAFGGRGERDALDTIEVFDPQSQTWSILNTKIPEPLAGFGLIQADELVHLVKYDKHFVYDPKTNVWHTDLPPMPTARHGLDLEYIDGVIYAIGGCSTGDGNLFDVARNEAFPLHSPAYLVLPGAPIELPLVVYPAMVVVAICMWLVLRRVLTLVGSAR